MIMLTNPDIYPSEAIIVDSLKTSANAYLQFRKTISETPFNLIETWRYYKDGKAWLCKISQKKKTICWLSVWDGHFKLGFYFAVSQSNEISDSDINFSHKELLLQVKPIGKLLPLTLEISNFNNQEDLENLLKIISLKIKLK